MANEYLQRTPTSTGNRKVFTWSSWLKKDQISAPARLFANYSASSTQTAIQFGYRSGSSTDGAIRFFNIISGSDDCLFEFNPLFRDSSSWFHLLVAGNTTLDNEDDRLIVYINGVRQSPLSSTYSASSRDVDFSFNTPSVQATTIPTIGSSNGSAEFFEGELSDIFYLDGQALTPDVFGFYKEGDGYVSAGSTISTDFRAGQWVPKRPRIIKTEIERRGGFGVNGFYLPMNDSSNPGADFHCDPNSIITLKGEDLPQPRNGAPTTTDAYVSQLRSDPYAANLVLAVPGISTATGSNLVSNGNFDSSDISDWTAGVQFSHNTNTVGDNTSGKLMYYATDSTTRQATKSITTESGKRYTISFEASSDTASAAILRIDSTDLVTIDDNNNASLIHYNTSFTAASSSTTIAFRQVAANRSYIDNIVVKQEDAPRDYSADIKGSGSNKTVTALGSAGVGYELGGYYGSAVSTSSGANRLTVPAGSDFAYGTGDFTVEAWGYPTGGNDGTYSATYFYSQAVGGTNYFVINFGTDTGAATGLIAFTMGTGGGGGGGGCAISATGIVPRNQWSHIAVVRDGTTVTLYLNGVAVGTATGVTFDANNTTYVPTLGAYTHTSGSNFFYNGYVQDFRIYKGVAKYKGGFDVPKPYTPVGIESWRTVADCTANNFATLNPLSSLGSSNITYTEGNLKAYVGSAWNSTTSTIAVKSGKWYAEFTVQDDTYPRLGVIDAELAQQDVATSDPLTNLYGSGAISWGGTANEIFINSTTTSTTTVGYTAGDIIGVAFDADTRQVWFSKNNTWMNFSGSGANPTTGTNPAGTVNGSDLLYFGARPEQCDIFANFGQNPTFGGRFTAGTNTDSNGKGLFKYAPPSGFLALCEDNLPAPAVADPGEHFKSVLWTGDGNSGRSITGVGFQPDFVWVKERTSTSGHHLYDSVRGPLKYLVSSGNNAENEVSTHLSSFDNDGWSMGSAGGINEDSQNYVAWCWKAGGPAVANTDGTITSQVSANQDAGFSIVSYTGNGSTGTVGHGLGKAPKFIIYKNRDSTSNWLVDIGSITGTTGDYVYLNLSSSKLNSPNVLGGTSSVLSLGNTPESNASADFIAYCWAEIEGFSKIGSYTGNNSNDGPFVYCGFKPAFVLQRAVNSLSDWNIMDNSRSSTNPNRKLLYPNLANAEGDGIDDRNPDFLIDFLSNGFKVRATNNDLNNTEEYIFAAFAESPFKTANAK